ncbi:unnamed protein product [Symbiodinium natans]|uniref:Reverse transcriptase domain-containing protein n=1 Tax=Symbiodinium natans TaxID=878477 RepID=A0A812N8Q1_9DINO|nr:unnamed protein product [Symbiodinium natans]
MGYTDHAALFITFDWEQNWNSFKWSFPYDLDSVPGLLQRCAKSQMAPLFPVDAANDCDTNLQAWVLSFESLAETVHEANAGCPLAKPFFGRLKGKRVKVKPSRLTLSSDGDEMVQRQALTYRSQCLRWVRELHHELLKHGSGWGQAHNLWRKILKCKGFDGSFAQWILDNEVASMVPVRVPSVTWLSMVSERLRDEERLWFQAIRLQSINCYKQNMAEDFRKGGRRHAAAVKGGSTAPLHSLAVFRPVEVQRVRVNKGSPARLILKSPVAVAPGDALKLGKTMCQIQACTPEVITLDAPMKHDMYKGAAALVSWSTEPAVVQEQVQTFWKQFWFPEQQPDLQFVQDNIQHMPALAPFDAAISFQPRITSPFAAITYGPFGCVESAFMGPGVAVLVVCIVCFLILAKVDNPMVPADGRPITVLPTLYRLWAKIQTKKVLQSILPWLPQELYGSVPGKSAQEMTLDLQASIEYAVATGSTLTGLSLDLSKAYNTIDRNVLQILARRVGWPNNLICSYMGFLNGLQRHFMAGGSLSESMGSSTGVPEGCPLAVTSMMLVTWLVTSVTKAKTGVVVHSYVDNWSLQHSQLDRPLMEQSKWQSRPTNLLCGFHLRKPTLMPLWQRTADASGAQKRQPSAATIQARTRTNEPKLQRLQSATWPLYRKVSTLMRVVVPSWLFGCEFTSMSKSAFKQLRGRMNTTLWGKHSNRDHFLAPLAAAPLEYEPFLWVLQQRVRTLRKFWFWWPAKAGLCWDTAVALPAAKALGPFSYFKQQVGVLQWSMVPDGYLLTAQGKMHILFSDPLKLLAEARQQWIQAVVMPQARAREVPIPASLDVDEIRSALKTSGTYNVVAANVPAGSAATAFPSTIDVDVPRHWAMFLGEGVGTTFAW